ncbi:MAG TPA: alpha/beta hydrolase [Allosphingosinicella sp.]|jgi:lysophospholipase
MKVGPIDRRALPPQARVAVWQSGDTWPMRRLEWVQPEGRPVRGSLLLLGGRGDFIEKYVEPLAYWHARGWNVTSFDWRSQGESQGSIKGGHLDSFDDVLSDGAALIEDWLQGARPHVAVGHSMGGHLLLRILAERRPPVAAAVLVAPMVGINSSPLPPMLAQAIAQNLTMFGRGRIPVWKHEGKLQKGSLRRKILTSCPKRYADELWWFEQRPAYSLGAPSWGWLAAAYRSIASLTAAKLRSIDLPVLLLGTERDRLVSPGAIKWAAELLPNSELMMFPEAGHEILREADPIRIAALERIDRFLDERAAA